MSEFKKVLVDQVNDGLISENNSKTKGKKLTVKNKKQTKKNSIKKKTKRKHITKKQVKKQLGEFKKLSKSFGKKISNVNGKWVKI